MIELLGIDLQYYGMVVALGAVLAVLLAMYTFRRGRISVSVLPQVTVLMVPLMLLFARLGYCVANFEYMAEIGLFSFLFDFSQGGYMAYGAFLGAALALLIASRWTKISFARLADAAAAPGALFIAVCRFGEGLVDSGYGWSVERWFDPE